MKKNSIIQRNLRIINLLLAEVVERKQHVLFLSLLVTDGLSNCCLRLNSLTVPVFFKLSFEFLQRFFNVFAFFYRYYNHFLLIKC